MTEFNKNIELQQQLLEEEASKEDTKIFAELAENLSNLPDPQAHDPKLLMQFMAKNVAMEKMPEARKFWPILNKVAAILLVAFVSTWVAVASSHDSLPGDFLYPVKRASESVRIGITRNMDKRFHLYVDFSERRLNEVVNLYKNTGKIDESLLQEMLEKVTLAMGTSDDFSDDQKPAYVDKLDYLTLRQQGALKQLNQEVPESQKPLIKNFLEHCNCHKETIDKFFAERGIACFCKRHGQKEFINCECGCK